MLLMKQEDQTSLLHVFTGSVAYDLLLEKGRNVEKQKKIRLKI